MLVLGASLTISPGVWVHRCMTRLDLPMCSLHPLLCKMHQMNQRILTVTWQIFARFLVEKLSGKNQTAFFSSSLLPCCILWSWVKKGVPLFAPPPTPKEFRNQKLNFSIAAYLQSSARWSWTYCKQNKKKIRNQYASPPWGSAIPAGPLSKFFTKLSAGRVSQVHSLTPNFTIVALKMLAYRLRNCQNW